MALTDLRSLTISDRAFSRASLAFLALSVTALIAAGLAAAWVVQRNQQLIEWVNHTYEVERELTESRNLLNRAELARRDYLIRGDEAAIRDFELLAAGQPSVLDRVERLTVDNDRQQMRIARLRQLVTELVDAQRDTLGAAMGDRTQGPVAFSRDDSLRRYDEVRQLTRAMIDEERQLLLNRRADQRSKLPIFYAVVGGAGMLLLMVAAAAVFVILRYTRDLNRSRGALQSLNDNLEAAVVERTADLTRANEEIQRFAYIVSHDLRSPLVNVMGFTAELEAAAEPLRALVDRAEEAAPHIVTADARDAARADLPEAIGFIRSSTEKMDRLINAILRLSRQGRRVLTRERIDMTALAGDVRAAVQHRIDELGATVVIEPLPSIDTDRLAVEQILSNLVENALKYLRPGVPGEIRVRGRREGGRVVIEVVDNGRGIDPKDHDRIFDLFRRSGEQDQPGEGIGLAHVRALAYRLGGFVDCRSMLGEGAMFRVMLPAVLAGDQGVKP